jgi:hypothetical protein
MLVQLYLLLPAFVVASVVFSVPLSPLFFLVVRHRVGLSQLSGHCQTPRAFPARFVRGIIGVGLFSRWGQKIARTTAVTAWTVAKLG